MKRTETRTKAAEKVNKEAHHKDIIAKEKAAKERKAKR